MKLFSDKQKTDIVFLRNLVGLIRDLVVLVVGVFAILIGYLGGEPEKLTVVDWTRVIGNSMKIVLTPFVLFVLYKGATIIFEEITLILRYMGGISEVKKVPKGHFLKFLIWKNITFSKDSKIKVIRRFILHYQDVRDFNLKNPELRINPKRFSKKAYKAMATLTQIYHILLKEGYILAIIFILITLYDMIKSYLEMINSYIH
ncbi:MAG: hypothetical protein IT258_18440 [Saprospiraceae bacterium]|nr:hypothetical protein [Saprospiraceae bacterium]